MKYYERTAEENQRGRPLDFFLDQFEMKYYEILNKIIKEEGLLISLSTSSKPSVKKVLEILRKNCTRISKRKAF